MTEVSVMVRPASVSATDTTVVLRSELPALPIEWPAKLLIDGKWIGAEAGVQKSIVSPINGSIIGSVEEADDVDIDKAVAVARRAFDAEVWTGLPADERAKILWRVGDLIEAQLDVIADVEP